MKKPTLEVTADFTADFMEVVKRFKGDSVLVGIPMEEGQRDDGEEITNAALLAINNFGSPLQNIPARPVLQIGIKNAKEAIAEQFKIAAQNALKQGPKAIEVYYERAGIIASNSVKKAINDQDFGEDGHGPAESTLKSRKAAGFKGTKSLVMSGQMRNSITYVLKSIWKG